MTSTYFLAAVIGWYLVIVSLIVLLRQRLMAGIVSDILGQRALLFFMGLVSLVIGLLLVISHNVWVMSWPVIITLIGWLAVISGILRMAFPDVSLRMGQWCQRRPVAFMVIAVVYLLIGLFLLYQVYGARLGL
ncbi:hypothetical protein DIZ81_04910 [Legionella taurinensis]|uniref:Integral membrane protein (PIN domain superfamily) n=1 Tax=Legionella taurinensis TaxID=70611 RepID=A0A3A5L5R3_9GAMM|nr:hypothetical protein [Legionella taurinensis]MDX1837012.1 hypothetical protein [Legionella taurinensis]PUT41418.1 hypothetical protein DB744_04910 [Legionella taurinensis]PUT42657.1 hypothetical protein DB746_07245 [Legionella taurinensis]PUT46685.1 hypothetical protein DB743_04645 [Legionella taurinensis]PUT47334.1 hypothetical protein DB745_08325 [Legionella taurinensis]